MERLVNRTNKPAVWGQSPSNPLQAGSIVTACHYNFNKSGMADRRREPGDFSRQALTQYLLAFFRKPVRWFSISIIFDDSVIYHFTDSLFKGFFFLGA